MTPFDDDEGGRFISLLSWVFRVFRVFVAGVWFLWILQLEIIIVFNQFIYTSFGLNGQSDYEV